MGLATFLGSRRFARSLQFAQTRPTGVGELRRARTLSYLESPHARRGTVPPLGLGPHATFQRRATLRAPLKIDTHNAPVRRRAFRAFLQPWKRAGPIELGDPTRTTREANRERSRGHLLPASFSRHTSHNSATEPHKGRQAPRCLDRAPSATRGAERGEEAHLRNYSCYSGSLNTKKLKYYTHSPLLS